MEIENKVASMFDNIKQDIVKNKGKRAVKIHPEPNSIPQSKDLRDAKALEFKLNKHLMNKYKKEDKVSFTSLEPCQNDNVYKLIENDVTKHISKSHNWKSMSMFEQWKHIQQYITQGGCDNVKNIPLSKLKQLLVNKRLTIDFDKDKKQITNIII
jgi:hypothetical protein